MLKPPRLWPNASAVGWDSGYVFLLGWLDAALFQKIVASAALDADVEAQIVEHLSQAADHPVALNFPEGAYLKGLVCIKL